MANPLKNGATCHFKGLEYWVPANEKDPEYCLKNQTSSAVFLTDFRCISNLVISFLVSEV